MAVVAPLVLKSLGGQRHVAEMGADDSVAAAEMAATVYDNDARRSRRILPAGGRYHAAGATIAGAITLELPVGMTSSMIRASVKIYEYLTNTSFEVHFGGYNYSTGSWINTFAYIISNPGVNRQLSVRFGRTAAGKAVVYIGELGATWAYPQVYITEALVGYSTANTAWDAPWAISFTTAAFENVTGTVLNPQVGYATVTATPNALVMRDASGGAAVGALTVLNIQSAAALSFLNGSAAQAIKVGGLTVSNSYSDNAPTNGIFSRGVIQSAVATGQAPMIVASTTRVANLNAASAGTADTVPLAGVGQFRDLRSQPAGLAATAPSTFYSAGQSWGFANGGSAGLAIPGLGNPTYGIVEVSAQYSDSSAPAGIVRKFTNGTRMFAQSATSATAWTGWAESANLDSPTFVGTPSAPTAAAATDTTQLATTAHVKLAMAAGSAPIGHVGAGGAAHANATTTVDGFMSAADKVKLNGVAANATANATDAALRTRSTHSGTQPLDTIDGLQTALNAKADLSNAAFTGAVTVITADTSENGNRVANTAFVKNAIAAEAAPIAHVGAGGAAHANATTSVDGFMSAADKAKLNGIAAGAQANTVTSVAGKTGAVTLAKADVGLNAVDNTADTAKPVSTAQQTALNLKANLASPTFTGTPQAPTPADGTRNGQVATTEFVHGAVGGVFTKIVTGGTLTLTTAEASNPILTLAGALTSNQVIEIPAVSQRIYCIFNNTSGAFTLTIKQVGFTTGTTLAAQGKRNLVYSSGVGIFDALTDFESIALTGVPTAPTAALGTNTTQVATMAAVLAANNSDTGGAATALALKTARNLAMTGDGSWTVSFNGAGNVSAAMTLANVATAGTYRSVTVNAKGLVTAGATVVIGLATSTTAAGTTNLVTGNTNTFLNVIETVGGAAGSAGSSTQITGAGTVTVASDTAGKLTITGAQNITGSAGSAAVWTTARGFTIGATTKNVNGSAAVSWTLSEVGAVDKTGDTMTGDLTVPSLNGGAIGGLRNKIINGKMDIAERGVSFPSAGGYTLDRWFFNCGTGAASALATVSQQVATFSPSIRNCLQVAITRADASIASNDFAQIIYNVEGWDAQDLIYNDFTLGFNVKSSKTGIHCIAFKNATGSKSYIAEYTVNAANTWERKSVTVLGGIDPSGDWDWYFGAGMSVRWVLACGSLYRGTKDSWLSVDALATANQVNCLDVVGNTFSITGVQLIRGRVDTEFEHRHMAIERELCQRYGERIRAHIIGAPYMADAYLGNRIPFATKKRVPPTIGWMASVSAFNAKDAAFNNQTADGFSFFCRAIAAGTITELVNDYWADAEI